MYIIADMEEYSLVIDEDTGEPIEFNTLLSAENWAETFMEHHYQVLKVME